MSSPAGDAVMRYFSDLLSEDDTARTVSNADNEYVLFTVCGLRLGIPAAAVEHNLPRPRSGRVLHAGDRSWQLLDTAEWILPPGHAARGMDTATRALALARRPYALLCDTVGESITIEPAGVLRRSAGTSRAWLEGTARAQGCALINVDELIRTAAAGLSGSE